MLFKRRTKFFLVIPPGKVGSYWQEKEDEFFKNVTRFPTDQELVSEFIGFIRTHKNLSLDNIGVYKVMDGRLFKFPSYDQMNMVDSDDKDCIVSTLFDLSLTYTIVGVEIVMYYGYKFDAIVFVKKTNGLDTNITSRTVDMVSTMIDTRDAWMDNNWDDYIRREGNK